tara:strand:+ start:6562 stop:7017 length:456 start_codon:yes stop_codon:yes gene_type:complete
MGTLNLHHFWEILNTSYRGQGEVLNPLAISLNTVEPHIAVHTIPDAFGKDVLWATGDGGKDTFTLAIITSTKDIWVELKDDAGTPNFFLHQVLANVPMFLHGYNIGVGAATKFDGAALVDNTDYNDIVQIEASRVVADGTGDAAVTVSMFD